MRVSLITILGACAALVGSPMPSPPDAPAPTKGVTFGPVPADAEVHYVAVYQPLSSGLTSEDVTDWLGLVKALRAKDGPAAYVRKQLPEAADELLTDEAAMGRMGGRCPNQVRDVVRGRLARALGQGVRRSTFYDKDVFAKVKLTKNLNALVALGDKRTVFQTEHMNRELLSLVFADYIAETPADYHTVRVCADQLLRAVAELDHARERRPLLGGDHPPCLITRGGHQHHRFAGLHGHAPIAYRAGIYPDGTKGPVNGFNAYKQDEKEPSYRRIKAEVEEHTGKGFASFQGQYQSGTEPFVVTPGAKGK